jgi:hypothetical protein
VGDIFHQQAGGQTVVDMLKLDLLVGSGGVLSHAPRMHQTAAMLIDSFEPEGITTLAKDSIFMMPNLGVLAEVHPQAALEVFDRDCLVYLGTCVAPRGRDKVGRRCFTYEITGEGISEQGELLVGDTKLITFPLEKSAEITVHPSSRFDFGAGPGKTVKKQIRGGTVGVILDARGRPLALPVDRALCRPAMTKWVQTLDLYPGAQRNA